MKFFDENHIVAGTEDGKICIIRVPDMKIVNEIHDSDSSVQSLKILKSGVLSGKYDGACVWYHFSVKTTSSGDNEVEISQDRIVLTGSDVDPIYSIASDEEFIYTASRDGNIRKYSIHEMFA